MARTDLTVIYYTSQREKPEFEERIRRTLWRTIKRLRLPLISVSQKPLDFGENICVGDHPPSSHNAFRQMQMGAAAAKTKFVILAESDFIHPREYFEFVPPREDTGYLAVPVWILFAARDRAKQFVMKPRGSEGAMVVGRDCLIQGIETQLEGRGTWEVNPSDGGRLKYLLHIIRCDYFTLPVPIVTFKTSENMHARAPLKSETSTRELPYWGNSADLLRRYMR